MERIDYKPEIRLGYCTFIEEIETEKVKRRAFFRCV